MKTSQFMTCTCTCTKMTVTVTSQMQLSFLQNCIREIEMKIESFES